MSVGSTDTQWAIDAFNKNSKDWLWGDDTDQVGAALALKGSQTLASTGAIIVDGTLTAAPTLTANTATFGADSVFIIDGDSITGGVALQADGNATLNVADGAKMLVVNSTVDKSFFPVYGFVNEETEAEKWQMATTDRMLTVAYNEDTAEKGDVKVSLASSSGMNNSIMSNVIQNMYIGGLNDINSSNAGISFLSKAVNSAYIANGTDAVKTIDAAAGMTALGGQQSSTLNGVKLFTGAIQNHMTDKSSDSHIWAQYIHSNSKVRDVSLGSSSFGFDNKFNGAVVGADFLATDSKHAGVAFAYGEGKVSGDGIATTNNNYKTWGLDVYHAWHNDKAVIMADLGYMKNDGEIKQTNLLGNLESDPTSTAWTAGVRGDFKTACAGLTPYAGLRYVRLTTDSHGINSTAGNMFNVGKDTQNIWLLPIGVQFSKRIAKGNGVFVPKADIGVLFAFGDKDTNASLSVNGVNASNTLGVAVTDSTSFLGSLGFTYETKKVNYGLAYQLQAGSKETRNGMWANVEFKF